MTSPPPVDLRSLTRDVLTELLASHGQPSYRATQLFRWIHRSGATSLDEMTNIPKALRETLAAAAHLVPLRIDALAQSQDGTQKARLLCADDAAIESVLIPRDTKLTLCISTQVGCALGCSFCGTATLGLQRNLTSGEIVDQVYRMQAHARPARISNIVFMGMGEPLANLDNTVTAVQTLCDPEGSDFSPRRITVSTAGLVPKIKQLGERLPQVGLAVSLHATDDKTRDALVPINKRWPIAVLMQALRTYPLPRRRRITIEYLVLPGINDRPADARNLPRLLSGIRTKINLLPYNPARTDQPHLRKPSEEDLDEFAEKLRAKDLTVTVRTSRGLDIAGACGQLALKGPT